MNLWEEILSRIETKVNRHSFYTWFKPTTFVTADARTITVHVPNPLFKDWLMKHYAAVITEAMGEIRKPKESSRTLIWDLCSVSRRESGAMFGGRDYAAVTSNAGSGKGKRLAGRIQKQRLRAARPICRVQRLSEAATLSQTAAN